MQRMNLGEYWIRWVKCYILTHVHGLCTVQTMSPKYQIYRGTHQGCPLSPLVFSCTIEPLAEIMRTRGIDRGIPLHDCVHTISLYADDLLLYLKDGETDLIAAVEDIDDFEVISGLIEQRESLLVSTG